MSAQATGRVVLTTFGSLGDLHPYLALALGLRARGHVPVVATSGMYRGKVEALGLAFHPVRPDMTDLEADPDLIRRLMDLRRGPEVVFNELVLPALPASFEDTLAAAVGADVLVSHPLTLATPLVAAKRGLPWASSLLAPIGFLSAYDPPVLPAAGLLARLRFLGPTLHRPLFAFLKRHFRHWAEPWHRFRAGLGLPPVNDNPIFDGQHSPRLALALFSGLLAAKQPDWPPQTVVTGFPFFDRDGAAMPDDLARFLDAGPPPVVFTLGSSAVHDAGPFYEHSARAAAALGVRAVLLVGAVARNRLAALPAGVAAFEYAPFSELFPRAAAIVHQGGVGTTAQAMRAGRPMLVMPYAHDQPDNAARVARLGIARVIARHRYTAGRAAAELNRLLGDPRYARRAAAVGAQVRAEDGVGAACAALERLLAEAKR
jgi:UDP:flavonoid glycosyltransferase YjiC (YdhE family)